MRQRLISGFFFLVMMIVVLHNVIPHHHHEEILMHNHDSHHDTKDAHSEDDHQPLPCLIQTLNFSIPRALTIVKFETPSDGANLFGIISNAVPITNNEFFLGYIPIPPGDPLDDEKINNLPPRAPPC